MYFIDKRIEMILLFIASLLILPLNCSFFNSLSLHFSDSLKHKCDALPYRTAYTGIRCYFAVLQEERLEETSAKCSSIFPGSEVATSVPSSIFNSMMVERSKFYVGSDSAGDTFKSSVAKNFICIFDSKYTCEKGDISPILPGKCITQAKPKSSYSDAEKYCDELGMEVPTVGNELENRMIRGAIVKDPLWIRNVYNGATSRKWARATYFGRYSTCPAFYDGRNWHMFAGWQQSTPVKNNWKMSSAVDKTGYWGNELDWPGYLMDVICIKNAANEFSKGAEPCVSYHEMADLPLLPLATFDRSITCYIEQRTLTRYQTIGKATVETKRGCEVLCDSKPTCAAFSFQDKGFSSSCILLSSEPTNQVCASKTTIFLKKTTGCVERTVLSADFGDDPCIESRNDSAFRGFGVKHICDPDKGKLYIIRAIDVHGRRISLDNERHNYIKKTGTGVFEYVFHQPGKKGGYTTVPNLVAATCAIAEGIKCPCKPLKHLADVPDKPNYPAKTDRVNPCNSASSYLWYDMTKSAAFLKEDMSQWNTQRAFVTCKAGLWIVWKESVYSSWAVNGLSCYK